jgi:hypothetical protein
MDHLLTFLNSWNFQAWREEVFYPLRSGAERSPEDLDRVRAWMREAVKPGSKTAELYRVLEVDLDGDILRAVTAFLPSPHLGHCDSRYALRMFWRVLFRRCAICHAWRLARYLKVNESFPWRVWRVKEYLMPRLCVGVLLGFFILLASSGLIDVFQHLQYSPRWYLAPAVFLLFVVGLAFANVQRQVGRFSGPTLFRRSLVLTGYGIAYAGLGAAIHYWGAPRLCYEVTGPFVCLCAASAMLLGFVFQLFWQDQALGDPL